MHNCIPKQRMFCRRNTRLIKWYARRLVRDYRIFKYNKFSYRKNIMRSLSPLPLFSDVIVDYANSPDQIQTNILMPVYMHFESYILYLVILQFFHFIKKFKNGTYK